MERSVTIIDREDCGEYFEGLILPEVYEKIHKEGVFLIGAIEEQNPVGAAVWEIEESRAQLASIGVAKDHQRQGIGTALLRYSMKVLHQTSCLGVYTLTLPGEEAADGLFRSFGMTSEEGGSMRYSIKLGDIADTRSMQGKEGRTRPLKEIPDSLYFSFVDQMYNLDESLFAKNLFDPDCSRFVVRDKRIGAGIFIEKEVDGLSVAWLHSVTSRPEDLMALFQEAVGAGVKKYSKDAQISFTCYSRLLRNVAEKLFGDRMKKESIHQWSLCGYRYRLADTEKSRWEEV